MFNYVTPAPSENNVEELKTNVALFRADIGFALDADGDRLAVIDKDGNYLDNNVILSLVYYYFVKYENKTGDVVKNCATTSLLDVLAKKFGFECHEVPVGFKHISSNLISTNSVVGGEYTINVINRKSRKQNYGKIDQIQITIETPPRCPDAPADAGSDNESALSGVDWLCGRG